MNIKTNKQGQKVHIKLPSLFPKIIKNSRAKKLISFMKMKKTYLRLQLFNKRSRNSNYKINRRNKALFNLIKISAFSMNYLTQLKIKIIKCLRTIKKNDILKM